MGKSCCVPLCNSHYGGTITFHEIPSKLDVREKWLRAISRGDNANPSKPWVPFDRSLVCSLHFKEDDFNSNSTRRVLKPSAVPSNFPGYPSYKSKLEVKVRKAPVVRNPTPVAAKRRKIQSLAENKNKENVPLMTHSLSEIPDQRKQVPVAANKRKIQELSVNANKENVPPMATSSSEIPDQRNLIPRAAKKRKIQGLSDNSNNGNVPSCISNDIIKSSSITDNPVAETSQHQSLTPKIDVTLPFKKTIKELRKKVNALQAKINSKDDTILSLMRKVRKSSYKPDVHQIKLNQIKEEADNGDIKANIILQQIEAFGKKHFRWSELCVRMCILLKNKSPRGYRFLRKYIANFPCVSTLQRFIGPSNLQTGFTDLVRTRLQEEFNALRDREITCSLIFDEMAISPRMVYSKRYDKVVGAAAYGKNVNGKLPIPANRLLGFVLKGVTTNVRIPVAYYLVRQLEGDDLADIILNVIKNTEEVGFRVRKLSCDDAKVNGKALKKLCKGPILPEIPHPFRPDEPLFIGYDVCHIIKNVRNQYLDHQRHWEKDGKPITSSPIKTLYKIQKGLPIKTVRSLTRKVVYPTNFEKMNVKRAVQIFSTEVISAIELCVFKNMHGFKNLDETINFMKMIQKWFSILNIANTTHYITSRDETKKQFCLLDDERLDWLENDFLGYLEQWKNSADAKTAKLDAGRKATRKATLFLTTETYNAIRITTLSSVAFIKYLLNNGALFVLTRKFTSDAIEQLFGSVRGAQGSNDQANALGSLQALELILKTGLVAPAVKGNCKVDSELISPNCSKNVANIKMPESSIMILNDRQKFLSRRLGNPPDISALTTKNAGVAWIAGFLLKLLKDRHPCPEALQAFTGSQSDKLNKLIELQDRGGLLYPSYSFVCFVNLVLDILNCTNDFIHKEALVKSWKLTLISILPKKCLECNCGALDHTEKIREIVIEHICKLYFVNITMDITDTENSKPKGKNPQLSKKSKKVNN